MDYNNILNNKRKFNELKAKTLNILEKATDKITEVTTTAVDTVVDKVKVKGQQQAKICLFQDVVSVINSNLIDESINREDFRLTVYKNKVESEMSIESIVDGLAVSFDETLRQNVLSEDYLTALYELVKVHYKYESEINFVSDENLFTINIIRAKVEEDIEHEKAEEENVEEEVGKHECDCEPKCDDCTCNQDIMTLEFIDKE